MQQTFFDEDEYFCIYGLLLTSSADNFKIQHLQPNFSAAEKEHNESENSVTARFNEETSDLKITYQCCIAQDDLRIESQSGSYTEHSDSGDWEQKSAPRDFHGRFCRHHFNDRHFFQSHPL